MGTQALGGKPQSPVAILAHASSFYSLGTGNGERPGDTRYHSLLRELREGKRKIETLTANFCKIYERPNMRVAHLDLRISHARSVFMLMSKAHSASSSTSSSAAASGGAIIAGTVLASANNADGGSLTISSSLLIFGFILALVLWQMRKLPAEAEVETDSADLNEVEEDLDFDFEISPPIELVASPSAAFEAAERRYRELEAQLAEAKSLRDAERNKLEVHAQNLLRMISVPIPAQPPSLAVNSEEKTNGDAL